MIAPAAAAAVDGSGMEYASEHVRDAEAEDGEDEAREGRPGRGDQQDDGNDD